jgi:hypothetical protein
MPRCRNSLTCLRVLTCATGHGVYRLMCITTKIYDIRRLYGGITEPRARSALLSHAHRCNASLDTMLVSAFGSFTCKTLTQQCHTAHGLLTSQVISLTHIIAFMRMQAAYNNTSEIELEGNDIATVEEPSASLYPIGTKVAKQFDGVDGELVWFEGVVQRHDEEDDLYWVLYNDGDSEDMNEAEVRDAVHDYRVHLKHEVVVTEAQIDACDSSLPNTSADVDDKLDVGEQVPATTTQVTDSTVLPPSNTGRSSSDIVVAMQAMTAAAERLTTVAARIEAAVQTQSDQQRQQQQQQQQQQYMLAVHPWQMQRHWQQVVHQRQQEQLRLAYYQQHVYNFKRQCLR